MARKRPAYWIAEGPVRGACGHKHRSRSAAHACAARDHRAVQRYHGPAAYSDREPVCVGDEGNNDGEE